MELEFELELDELLELEFDEEFELELDEEFELEFEFELDEEFELELELEFELEFELLSHHQLRLGYRPSSATWMRSASATLGAVIGASEIAAWAGAATDTMVAIASVEMVIDLAM